jgi:hypothetical protein
MKMENKTNILREIVSMVLFAALTFAALLMLVAFNPAEASAREQLVACDTDTDCCDKNPDYCDDTESMPQNEIPVCAKTAVDAVKLWLPVCGLGCKYESEAHFTLKCASAIPVNFID